MFFDRPNGAVFLRARDQDRMRVRNNVLIGARQEWPGNRHYDDRDAAGAPPFPYLKKL